MERPTRAARRAATDINRDARISFVIPGTDRTVRFCPYVRPYTIERLTEIWAEIEESQAAGDAAGVLKYAAVHTLAPYGEAALLVLNSYWKIRLFLRPLVWWWAYVRQYSVEQMNAVIAEGKKKMSATLLSYYGNMALTLDMREDWMKMTGKEAEQFQAELSSAAGPRSSRNTPNSERQGGSSSAL